VAALSMAGFPPLLGFVSKEEAFAAFLGAPGGDWLAPLAAALALGASIMTFAYGARIFDGAFEGPATQRLFDPKPSFYGPAALTALAGLGLGIWVSRLDPFMSRVASDALGAVGHVDLRMWHGLEPALALSALTIAAGTAAFVFRRPVGRALARIRTPVPGSAAFDRSYDGLVGIGKAVGRPFLSDAPARHLLWVLGAVATAGLAAWLARGEVPPFPAPAAEPADWAVLALLGAAILGAARTHTRIAAVALVGIAGFLVAVLYVLFGAPDLALTQLLIETLTVVLVVLVFRRLPQRFRAVARIRQLGAAAVAVTMGTLAALATYTLTGRRGLSEAGAYFLSAAPDEAGGENVVNTILVDFRALDTLGEITVLAVAALGVIALVRLAGRGRPRRTGGGGEPPA
jgi:multicomponent Na+:H+ antiporter subunit A